MHERLTSLLKRIHLGVKDTFGKITGQIIVGKGDVITSDKIYQPASTDVNSAVFYPMKGAN